MRWKSHVRFGGRAEETDRSKGRYRASVRSNHYGATVAAHSGATTKELMARLGHSTPRAALIYQHAAVERDHEIADRVGAVVEAAKPAPLAAVLDSRAG
jgi:hypothetical protein